MAPWLADTLLAAAIALTYLGSLDGGFVSDDVGAILHNPLLRSLAPSNLAAIFTSFDDANYIPLKVLSLAIDQRVWGPEPFGYHLTNLALHIVCAILARRILRRLNFSPGAAWLTAALWALHPLQVESVAFMSERKNVLSTACFLAAFLRYLDFEAGGRWTTLAAVCALFLAALLSKMNTVVLPAICLVHAAVVTRRVDRRVVLTSLLLFALGAVVVWYNLAGNPIHGAAFHGGSARVTWLTSATVPFRYLALVLYPARLRTFYYVPLYGSPFDAPVLLALLGLVAFAALTAWLCIRGRREGFWLAWAAIALAPMLNLVPFATLMQDRYVYLPLLGALAAPATALDARLRGAPARRVAAALGGAIALVWALLSVGRIEVWHDGLSLWRDWATQEWYLPADRGALRIGDADADAKRAILEAAAAAEPGSALARHNLGAMAYDRGNLPQAIAELEAAAQLDDRSGVIWQNLGRAYVRAGDPVRGAAALERAAALEPYAFFTQLNLARARLALGDAPAAQRALAACARLRPQAARLWSAEQAQLDALTAAGR